MDTDAGVKKLVELIFGKKPTIPEEMATHSYIPSDMLNEDFSKRLSNVLDFRQNILIHRWKDYFDSHFRNMLLSHMTYISFLMSSCLSEYKCNENIFDSFISVCVLLSYLSEETLSKVGLDFRELNPDIFMVFFRNALRSSFRKHRDLNRLVEYIRDHKYLKWSNDSTASASQERHLEEKKKELDSYRASEILSHDMAYAMQVTGASLASDVLSSTSVKLPDLPSEYELIPRLVEYKKRKKANEADGKRKVETILTLETSHIDASFNSDFKHNFGEQQEISWHESIIKAVIRHNHLKYSCAEIANNQSQEEANGILKNLESKIKSLTEVLDECNEE